MKKVFIGLWILICSTFMFVVNAAEVDIDDVVNALNTGNVANSYKESGGSIKVTHDEDSVDIKIDVNNDKSEMSFSLEGSIVTAYIKKDDKDAFSKAYIMQELIEEASILHGYRYGEITNMINSGALDDYKIETHGLQQTLDSKGNLEIKVDVSKKIQAAKLDDVYLEKTDLESYREYIAGDGSCGKTKGNIYFYMNTVDNTKNIVIAEKVGITDNSYMSFMSVIEIMFNGDADAISKITSYVPDFMLSSSNSGILVNLNESEIAGDVNDYEYLKNNGYSIVLIKIEKDKFPISNDTPLEDDNTDSGAVEDSNKEEDKKNNKEKEEKSGLSSLLKDKLIIIIAVIVVLLVIVLILINRKGKSSTKLELVSGNKGVIQPSIMQTHVTNEVVESLDDISTLEVQAQFNDSFSEVPVDNVNQVQPIAEQGMMEQSAIEQSQMMTQQMMEQSQMFDQPVQQPTQSQSFDQSMNQNMYYQQDMSQSMVQQPMVSSQDMNQQNIMNPYFNNNNFDNNQNN